MSTDSESLSEILQGSAFTSSMPVAKAEPATDVKPEPAKEPAAAPSAAKAEPEAEKPKAEQARDESGKFAKADPKPVETKKPEPMVPLSALLAERAKRKEPEAQKPKTSFLENEDAAFQERATETLTPIKEQLFEMSLEFARGRYDDFDEVASVFTQAANNDDRLWQQMRDARNPALYVYQVGKQFKELAPFGGDVVRYRDHSVSETKAELAKANEQLAAVKAELESLKTSKAALEAVPRSLNSSPSGAQPTVADADDESIQSITRFGKTKP